MAPFDFAQGDNPPGGQGVPVKAPTDYNLVTRGRLASTGMKKKLQRAQVQSPGKTVWNVSTANTELALAA
jgi:hypothetical protein